MSKQFKHPRLRVNPLAQIFVHLLARNRFFVNFGGDSDDFHKSLRINSRQHFLFDFRRNSHVGVLLLLYCTYIIASKSCFVKKKRVGVSTHPFSKRRLTDNRQTRRCS